MEFSELSQLRIPSAWTTACQSVKGAGGSSTWRRSKSNFLLVLTEGSVRCQMRLLDQKILFLAEVIKYWNPENMDNYSTRTNFTKRVFPKMDKKFIFYRFWDKCLKLGSYVLGTNTKLLIEPIFDYFKASEVKISNFENFKVQYFHFWDLNQKSPRSKVLVPRT